MKVEYEQIKEGIFKGYTVAYEKKYVGVFSCDAEYKRSTLAATGTAENFVESDKENQILQAYCFDFAKHLVSCVLKEIKKEANCDEKLFNFRLHYNLCTIPATLAVSKEASNLLLEVFDFYSVKNFKSVAPENQQQYCKLTKNCHDQIEEFLSKAHEDACNLNKKTLDEAEKTRHNTETPSNSSKESEKSENVCTK